MRTFVIGDIHGYCETLIALVSQLALQPGDTLICVGDYIDRGPNSNGVIAYLLELKKRGIIVRGLFGNHETAILTALGYGRLLPPGIAVHEETVFIAPNGFPETAKSYGWNYVPSICNLEVVKFPDSHLEFLLNLEQYVLLPGFLIVHAHLGQGALRKSSAQEAVEHQLADDPSCLQHQRDTFSCAKVFPELLIHGHTPIATLYLPDSDTHREKGDVRVIDGRLNLDSTVIRNGPLTAVELPSLRIIQQPNIG